jgi:tRNA 2-thiouridine synthesizing protein E
MSIIPLYYRFTGRKRVFIAKLKKTGAIMSAVVFDNKTYHVDSDGFLIDSKQWDEDFAVGMASSIGLTSGLTRQHWRIINFIRRTFSELGKCPLVYQTCKMNGLHLKELKELFPTGYLRGACKLAGITYKEGFLGYALSPVGESLLSAAHGERIYHVDVRGFLVDPVDWDEAYAIHKAFEMKMPCKLGDKHWEIIYFLRNRYRETRDVPTVYETCEGNRIGLDELEELFPDGYHRGAVKIAGLRVR